MLIELRIRFCSFAAEIFHRVFLFIVQTLLMPFGKSCTMVLA